MALVIAIVVALVLWSVLKGLFWLWVSPRPALPPAADKCSHPACQEGGWCLYR